MAVKKVTVPTIGEVTLYKRKGARSLKLSITHDGDVRISMPVWMPYRAGVEFAKSKSTWIQARSIAKTPLRSGERIGKAHRLLFVTKASQKTIATRVNGTDIKITLPALMTDENPMVQKAAETAAMRALKKEATQLLPPRLASLAEQHGFNYRSVKVKQLKSRWGSCSNHGDIVLNCFLMQLPWHLIDYVLLHELMHTQIMAHGKPFWSELAKYVANLPGIRREIKAYKPVLIAQPHSMPLPPQESAPNTPIAIA